MVNAWIGEGDVEVNLTVSHCDEEMGSTPDLFTDVFLVKEVPLRILQPDNLKLGQREKRQGAGGRGQGEKRTRGRGQGEKRTRGRGKENLKYILPISYLPLPLHPAPCPPASSSPPCTLHPAPLPLPSMPLAKNINRNFGDL